MSSLVQVRAESDSALAPSRQWSTEQDGPNDKQIEIWYNANWVPAFFKDIQKGDFFLILGVNLDPTQCFVAKSGIRRSVWKDVPSFTLEGLEVIQRSSITEPAQLTTSYKELE